MAPFNDPKFVVYTKGYYLDQLCLGHLVLGRWYKDPVDRISFCCPFPRIEEQHEAKFTRSSDWSGKLLVQQGSNFALDVEALDLLHLSPALQKDEVKLLDATKGRRVELRNLTEYFESAVLKSDAVKKRIQNWLSVTRTNFMFNRFLRRRPKLWMLTAVYELEGVKTYSMNSSNLSAELGISSAAVGAMGGPPIGGSLAAGSNRALAMEASVQQPMVYAARWQLLKTEWLESDSVLDPLSIVLHPDNVYSVTFVMGGDDEEENELEDAEIAVLECAEASRSELEEEDAVPEEYWEAFREAERLMLSTM